MGRKGKKNVQEVTTEPCAVGAAVLGAAEPRLDLSPGLEALIPAVADVVAACSTAAVSPACLAAALLQFLQLKAAMGDTGRQYVMSPPLLIDHAWHALLLETPLAADVYAALGVPIIHHSDRQPGGDAAHAARLRATFSAALYAATYQHPSVPARRLPPLDALIWGVPDRSDILVRVTLLPLPSGDPSPALCAYLPHHSSISDLTEQLQRMYGAALERFRPSSPSAAPLHPAKLLSRIGGGGGGSGGGSGGAGGSGSVHLFAAPLWPESSGLMSGTATLQVNGDMVPGLDGGAPLRSVLALERFGPPPVYVREAGAVPYFVVDRHCGSEGTPLDDTQPLSHFSGADLSIDWVLRPAVEVPLAVRHGAVRSELAACLPEAWVLADLTAWVRSLWGQLGTVALFADGAPAPSDLSHLSSFSALDAVVVAASPSCTLSVKTLIGYTITLTAARSSNVALLHHLIQKREGIPVDQQRLIFAGQQLSAGRTLEEQGVTTEATLHLVLRLCGC